MRDHVVLLVIGVFEEISSLLDKHRYRMRLVFWAAKRLARGDGTVAALGQALDEYRLVVTTYNDNLNAVSRSCTRTSAARCATRATA